MTVACFVGNRKFNGKRFVQQTVKRIVTNLLNSKKSRKKIANICLSKHKLNKSNRNQVIIRLFCFLISCILSTVKESVIFLPFELTWAYFAANIDVRRHWIQSCKHKWNHRPAEYNGRYCHIKTAQYHNDLFNVKV